MHSVDLLIEALNKYEGSYILVSHDRYFVNQTANKIWEIEDHKIREFVGTYDEWEEWKQRKIKAQNEKLKPEKVEKPVLVESKATDNRNNQRNAIDKDAKKELQKTQKRFQQIEEKIASLNKQKLELENSLASHEIYSDKTKFAKTESDLKEISKQLTSVNSEYETVFDKLMQLQ